MSPLPEIGPPQLPAANCGFARGCADSPPAALPADDVAALVKDHPCYSEEAHHHFARMHVAVAPGCNIQCHYCHRKYDCANESRPGVVSERLSPEDAVRKVLAVAAEVPELSVVGIAGPGDALASAAADLRDARGDTPRRAGPHPVPLDERPRAPRARGAARRPRRPPRDGHRQHDRPRDRRADLPVDPPGRAEGPRPRGVTDPVRAPAPRDLAPRERGVLVKVNSVVIPGRERRAPPRGDEGGPGGGRVRREPRPAHLGARARHALRPLRTARTDRGGAGARADGLRARSRSPRPGDAALPAVPRRRGRPARRGSVRGVHAREAPAGPGARRAGAQGRTARGRGPRAGDRDAREQAGAPERSSACRGRSPRAWRSRRRRAASSTSTSATPASSSCTTSGATAPGSSAAGPSTGTARAATATTTRSPSRFAPSPTATRSSSRRWATVPKGQLAAAGIEPVTEHAFQPIEVAALAWFERFAARVARGEVAPRRRAAAGSPGAGARAEVA